jgi:hypothetical protein
LIDPPVNAPAPRKLIEVIAATFAQVPADQSTLRLPPEFVYTAEDVMVFFTVLEA